MCGIAGIVKFNGKLVHEEVVWRMLRWLHHRGPDEHGVWCNGSIGMGTARLSIIDLLSGRQPIANEDETVWVSFNGEIYNFLELRRYLEQEGHRFRTRTDTEVIVHAYEEWQEEFVKHLKGMFGLALVDLHTQRLYLARDIAGEKPLFYTVHPGFFGFASEIKPLLHELPLAREIDPLAVESFFAFSRPVGHLCAFRSIQKLLPGQMLRLDITTGAVVVSAYWQPPSEKYILSPEEAGTTLLGLLEDSIQRFLIADVPIGAFLSGGTDSSAVVAMMRRYFDTPVKTFTAVYDDPHISEAQQAQQVAKILNTEHHEIHICPTDVLQALPKLIWHLEEPFADASFIPAYFVSKRARELVKVALTGDGGDELFGGYDSYLAWQIMEIYRRLPKALRATVGLATQKTPLTWFTHHPRLYHYLVGTTRLARAAEEPDDIEAFLILTGDGSLPALLTENVAERLIALRRATLDHSPTLDSLDRILLFQFRGLLPELFFTKVDRMSMANSLECRSPLVYSDIVEFALRLPVSLKIRGTRRKYLLKRVLESFLPTKIIYRPKKGFSIPLYRWLREDPKLRGLLERYALCDGPLFSSECRGINPYYIAHVTRAYLEGKHNRWVLPWKAICFGIWWETFVKRDGKAPLEDLIHDVGGRR